VFVNLYYLSYSIFFLCNLFKWFWRKGSL